ncbi:MAG TPA: NAD(P)/FAD-dependent oxidoreductase [Candidatus Limnocylindrales bacterium]|nr:NAD(P)/FAD-dependent oxidoreductase [Candidatus Limnocylindrales bacterium]
MSGPALDAIVVGAGPNGLAAAIELARAERSVRVYEAADTVGGGTRSAELTLPGFVHDVCASVHPLSLASPFLRSLDLGRHGLEWVQPDAPVAHALAPGRSVVLERDLGAVDDALGRDADAWRRLFGPYVREWERLVPGILGPILRPPRHPLLLARFGLPALMPATALARLAFREAEASALFAGLAAHSMLRLGQPLSGSFGLVLGLLAHAVGWPVARGGSGAIAAALEAEARSLGVEFVTGHRVEALAELPPARAYLLDVTPRQVLAMAGDRLPSGYRRELERFRYGPGVFKIDWALDGLIPWQDPSTLRAGTVHLGGTHRAIAASEEAVGRGRHPATPFVLLVQPTIADPTRAPEGKHVAWAYCHVPNGSTVDMTAAIESQVERFAPGFRDLVLARATKDSVAMEAWDANYVGGDINGGIGDWRQLLFRPAVRWNPYTTPDRSVFICSSSTPPGGGVHGMSGRHAAREAERWLRGQ